MFVHINIVHRARSIMVAQPQVVPFHSVGNRTSGGTITNGGFPYLVQL